MEAGPGHYLAQALLDLIEDEKYSTPDLDGKQVMANAIELWFGEAGWSRAVFCLRLTGVALKEHISSGFRERKDRLMQVLGW